MGRDLPVGLVTNGERWMLVHAPVGAAASFASWYARLWGQEPETLRAFVSLLDVRRFYGPEDERLPALHERSLKHQDEVTEALGAQVRRAVEVLVQSVDRADQDRERELLRDTEPRELYEAALTVMMRLVFLLAAEERGLLLLNDPRYDENYALSTLRMQLRAEPDEVLERRRSAWSRLLALFRAVYGGVDHPAMAMPALGGSLFDPDRYPFLEGRARGDELAHDAGGAAPDRRPDGPPAPRRHPGLPGADALVPGTRRGANRARLRRPARTDGRARGRRDAGVVGLGEGLGPSRGAGRVGVGRTRRALACGRRSWRSGRSARPRRSATTSTATQTSR